MYNVNKIYVNVVDFVPKNLHTVVAYHIIDSDIFVLYIKMASF